MILPQQKIPGLGRVMQLAYVPEDYDAALKSWTDFGVGPFYKIDRAPFSEVTYRGQIIDPDITSAFSYWGDMQIELIRQNNAAESIFRTWQDQRRTGLQHICIQVEDIEDARARCQALDYEIVQEARAGDAGRFFYAAVPNGPACLVEFAQIGPPFTIAFEKIRAAAANWDGIDPVRSLGALLAEGSAAD